MEFLLIGDSKLKIIMTDEDMAIFNLNTGADYASASYRRAFWKVLDLAKEEVGFDPDGDKVLIQFYPVKSGGCEVFVTKLGILSKESARFVSRSDKVTMLSKARGCYAFEKIEDLKSFAISVKATAPPPYPNSDVYISAGGKPYLIIEEYGKGGESSEFPSILEYSRALSPDFEFFISEHLCRLTNGDAIEKISELTIP